MKQSLEPNPRFPHIPLKAKVWPDPHCHGCPFEQAEGHGTCHAFGPQVAATEAERMNLADFIRWQYRIWRRQFDAEGVKGAIGDDWYAYNATGSFNFADAASGTVVSVAGDTAIIEMENPREYVLYSWRERSPDDPRVWINGFQQHGCPWPLDVGIFSENSILHYLCEPVVVQILGSGVESGLAANQLQVKFDKDVSPALEKFPIDDGMGGTMPDPNPVTIRLYQHAGNPYKWQFIRNPTWFYGSRQKKDISLGQVPADGIFTLEADKSVMWPGGFLPLQNPTWILQGRRRDNKTWENVPEMNSRLFTLPLGPSKVALKTLKPAENDERITLSVDLTVDYEAFQVTYYRATTQSSSSCTLVGHGGCQHAMPDPTNSIGNYWGLQPGETNGKGISVDAQGKHWYCAKMVVTKNDAFSDTGGPDGVPDGIDDTVTPYKVAPSGVTRFPASGQCRQAGSCNFWEAGENNTGRDANFRFEYHAARYFYELWGGTDARREQYAPLIEAYFVTRVLHPSISWHAGYFGSCLVTPGGMHPKIFFNKYGAWGNPVTFTDAEGNQYLSAYGGATHRVYPEDLPLGPTDVPGPGHFASEVDGFINHRDPLAAASTMISDELERIGWRVERDTGELKGRGMTTDAIATAPQTLVIPNLSKNAIGPQVRSIGTFEVEEATGDGILQIMPLRPEVRGSFSLGTRGIHSATDLGAGLIAINLEPGPHTFSVLDLGSLSEIGDSYDRLITFNAGGAPPVYGADWQLVASYYENDKTLGSRFGGARRGDCVRIGGDLYFLDGAQPFAGPEALTWGSRQIARNWTSSGYFHAPERTVDGVKIIPRVLPASSGNMVRYQDTGAPLNMVFNADRPPVISEGFFWYDEAVGRILFSEADALRVVIVRHQIEGDDPDYAEDGPDPAFDLETPFTIESTPYVTDVASAEWGGATAGRAITADGATLTEAAGAPGPGQYQVDTSGATIEITTNIADAAKTIAMVLDYATEAAAPEDGYSTGGNYVAMGAKKMDVLLVWDNEEQKLANNLAALAAETAEVVAQEGILLSWGAFQSAFYTADNWENVPGGTGNGAAGKFRIPAATMADLPESFCLRVTDAVWMDYRGLIPGSLANKTEEAIESLEWVDCEMEFGPAGSYGFYREAIQIWWYGADDPMQPCNETHHTDPLFVESWPSAGNWVEIRAQAELGGTQFASHVMVSVESSQFPIPGPLKRCPDNTVVVEAWAQISCSGLTRSRTYGEEAETDCDGNIVTPGVSGPPDTTVENVSFAVLGFKSPTDFDQIGVISGAKAGDMVTTDFAPILQKQLDARKTALYPYGYGIVVIPSSVGLTTGDVSSMLPGEGPTRGETACPGTPCEGTTFQRYYTTEIIRIEWDNANLVRLKARLAYPDADKNRTLVTMRPPSAAGV